MSQPKVGPRLQPVLAAGVAVMLFSAPWFIPVLGVVFSLAAPLPLVLLFWSQGPQAGRLGLVLALLGAMAAALGVGHWALGLCFFFHAGVALVLGEAPWRRLNAPWAVALATLAGGGVVLALVLAAWQISGQPLGQMWQEYWSQEAQTVLAMYRQSGLEPEEAQALNRGLERIAHIALAMSPGILLGGTLLFSWVNLLWARMWWKRRRPESAGGQDLTLWKAPEPLVWGVILAGGLMWAGEGVWFWAGANILAVAGVIYFLDRKSVV